MDCKTSKSYLHKYEQNKLKDYDYLLDQLDAVDDGISSCDENGRITYINKSGSEMLNVNREEIIGQKVGSLISDSILIAVLESKKTFQDIRYTVNIKDKNVHLMTSAYPVYDEQNNIIGAIDIFRRIKRSIKSATDLAGYAAIYNFEDFIGSSKFLLGAIELSKRFSHSDKNVLITGESGTGKELFAQSIHNNSIRKNNPFIAINCASYPKELFDSELFGYEEGAFTGARKGGKTGKFELADGGTLFLDEIGEMPLHLQAKLLRVIESKSITKIGGNKNIYIDVRIIAATNRNLEEMVSNNSFREDLYYRLKVLFLHLEPLRNRQNDCVLLANYFIKKFAKDSPNKVVGLSKEAKKLINDYKWPGNIRELENVISLALFYCDGDLISKSNLINSGLNHELEKNKTDNIESDKTLSKVTKEIVIEALEKNNGNKTKTAEELGISRSTIYRILS